ncbi:MAG: hypothetical protein ACRDFT_00415 [bacterium]
MKGRRSRRLLSRFWAIFLLAALAAGVTPRAAATPRGWTVAASPHIHVYAVTGDPASAARAAQVSAELERVYGQVISPLQVRPLTIIYPLFPSAEQYRTDWWQFASQAYGDLVYAWGTIDHGDPGDVSAYALTRAVVLRVFPRAIPFLRWGLGDALGDTALGVDPHRHLRALQASGQAIPELRALLPPADFGSALPVSYPVAVSFMAYLVETYGAAETAAFVADVEFKYYDFGALLQTHFGTTLDAAERRWRQAAARGPAPGVDVPTYLAVTQFVYRTTLAGSPSRVLLEAEGATVVDEAFRAVLPLRRLEVAQAASHMEAAFAAAARADRASRLRTTTARSLIGLLIIAPILLAIGLLVWPAIRAKRAEQARTSRGHTK